MELNAKIVGNTYTYSVGTGKPLYVINGGPGLDYKYIEKFMLNFKENREIIFYDQIGTGKDFDMSIRTSASELSNQLADLLFADKRPKDVLAHSWGTYLALSLYEKNGELFNIDNLILVNPFALDYDRYTFSGQRLLSRFPEEIMDEVESYAKENTKTGFLNMMKTIAPYYTHNPNITYNFSFETYNSPIEDSIYSSIVGFNHSKLIKNINNNIFVVKCDDDFISFDDTIELQKYCTKCFVIEKCGHFPFVEKSLELYDIIRECIN